MSHSIELQIIESIQQFRNPVFDVFFKFLNLFDTQEFLFVLIPAFWLGKGWKTGLRLFYILALSGLTNHALKGIFLSPRPFHLDPSLGIIEVSGYGFPSGAAQTVILLSGILLTYWKSQWKWCVALLYTLLISFSRIYLGVHFPTDIVGGWVVGFCLWMVYVYVRPPLERQLDKLRPLSLFFLSQLIPLLLLFWQHFSHATRISGCAVGMGAGLFINHARKWSLPTSRSKKELTLRASVGVIGTFLLYFLVTALPMPNCPFTRFLQFFVLGLWIATGALLLCRSWQR